MSSTKTLLQVARDAQAMALVGENVKFLKGKKKKTSKKVKDFAGLGVKNIVGIELLRAQAGLAAGL